MCVRTVRVVSATYSGRVVCVSVYAHSLVRVATKRGIHLTRVRSLLLQYSRLLDGAYYDPRTQACLRLLTQQTSHAPRCPSLVLARPKTLTLEIPLRVVPHERAGGGGRTYKYFYCCAAARMYAE